MTECPCEDCITKAICKGIITNTIKPRLTVFSLINKCELIREYINYNEPDGMINKYNETLKAFNIYRLK